MEVLSSEYARAVKIQRETKGEKRLERRDRRERDKGPENSCTVKVLVFQTSTRLKCFQLSRHRSDFFVAVPWPS